MHSTVTLRFAKCSKEGNHLFEYAREIDYMTKRFEQTMNSDDKLYLTDAISIHGQLSHEEKASFLKLFMGDENQIHDADIRILLATSGVANAGINCNEIFSAVRIEFPPSIMDICQEKGRVGRVPSASPDVYSYVICYDIESFIL